MIEACIGAETTLYDNWYLMPVVFLPLITQLYDQAIKSPKCKLGLAQLG
jgi:hypothetical protein